VVTASVSEAVRDDRELLVALRDGGDGAFRALFERHADPVFSFVVKLVRDDALAEDVLQETFLRIHRGISTWEPARPARPWIYGIARNAALDALRQRKKADRLEDESARRAPAPERETVVPGAIRSEEAALVRAALASLPDETRALLVQRHGLGMELEELAASWSVNERTIRTRLGEAAARLATALSRAARGGAP
jgi:RNA polymerase sigma-70 factor (ECF subfamily)